MLLVLFALGTLRGRLSAAYQHLAWVFAFSVLLLLPLLRHALPVWQLAVPVAELDALPVVHRSVGAMGSDLSARAGEFVLWLWAIGTAVLLARLAWGLVHITRFFGSARALRDTRCVDLLDDLRRELGIRSPVDLRIAVRPGAPAAWGLPRAVIVLPESSLAWSEARLRMVMLHELAHIRRADTLARVLAEVVVALHWFNPLAWAGARRLRQASEQACDEVVLHAGVAPLEYARELADLVRTGVHTSLAAMPALASGPPIERRIQAILDQTGKRRSQLRWPQCAIAITLVGIVFPAATLKWQTAAEMIPARLATDFAARFGVAPELASLITTAAHDEGIDVELAFRLVRTESGFRNAQVSRGGAVGLTQLLPSTAASLQPAVTPQELLDPSTNLHLGFRLLRRHLDDYQGNTTEALLAYHLGQARLRRMRAAGEDPPLNYANRVLHDSRGP